MFKRQTKAQRTELKRRGIRPAPKKASAANPRGQTTGGWSPFAPPVGRQDIVDDVEYEAFDRAKGRWYTNKPKP